MHIRQVKFSISLFLLAFVIFLFTLKGFTTTVLADACTGFAFSDIKDMPSRAIADNLVIFCIRFFFPLKINSTKGIIRCDRADFWFKMLDNTVA